MAPDGPINVEVVFALPGRQALIPVTLPRGSTVADAIEASAVAQSFPDHDLSACRVGIWGRPVGREQVVGAGDRIEIYRPLEIDPREARRKLAAEGRFMGKRDDSKND